MRRFSPVLVSLLLLALGGTPAFAGKVSTRKGTTTSTTTTTTTTTPNPVSAGTYFGFNDNSVGLGQLTAAGSASLASQGGATTSRVAFDWRYAEASPGQW